MKSKFKFSNFLLLLATVSAFVLSIVLWIFIMTNDQYFSHIDQSSNVAKQTRNRRGQIISNLYIPTSSYGFKDGHLYRLYDAKNNLPLEFIKELKEAKYENITKVSTTQDKYEQMLNDPAFIQLTFPGEVNVNLFTKKQVSKKQPNFRRVFVSSSNNQLYLGNDQNFTVYRVDLAKTNFTRLRKYARKAKGKIPVEFVRLKDSYEVFYTNQERWRVYSYLTSSQTDSYFVSRLLGTSNVTMRTNKEGWTYSLNYYTKLHVHEAKSQRHDFLYTNYEKRKNSSATDNLLESVEYVHKLGLNEQDLRYFDTVNGSLSYMNYIEGIPVFWGEHSPQITTTFTQDAVEVAFNNIDLQIPIPFDGQTRTIPTSQSVMQKLVNAGLKKSEIQRIIVAFHVEKDNTHDNLVNLIPGYYIKAYDQWKSLDEWEQQDFNTLNKEDQTKPEGGN